jgi:hypothetical protein
MIIDSVRQSPFSELPEDVGMLIFQLIAEVDRKTGLSCALVSQKVNAWCVYSWKDTPIQSYQLKFFRVEPILFRNIVIRNDFQQSISYCRLVMNRW